MSNVTELKQPCPKSQEAMVELTKGLLDTLYKEKVTYLEISYKTDKDNVVKSTSIIS